jgi:hypothetical protein
MSRFKTGDQMDVSYVDGMIVMQKTPSADVGPHAIALIEFADLLFRIERTKGGNF